ncbi:hypothetical protein DPMN_074091 [Dreissena polymorpha]|uniref:Uncharacterized protein n=1 Tax=Dreissena polymorpha TaxID=45954 RepID=A0A9D4BN02_DREPO|nr:hypothetical protein DPMN_074091 [Dreissena polymorpha]
MTRALIRNQGQENAGSILTIPQHGTNIKMCFLSILSESEIPRSDYTHYIRTQATQNQVTIAAMSEPETFRNQDLQNKKNKSITSSSYIHRKR